MIFRARRYRGEHQRDVAYQHIGELVQQLHLKFDLNIAVFKALEGRRPVIIVGAPQSFWRTHWRELEWYGGHDLTIDCETADALLKRHEASEVGHITHESGVRIDRDGRAY
jgi:hypothetical protein